MAYVSYNTYPGWKLRGAFRDMMRFHTRNFTTADEKVEQSRALLGFLVDGAGADTLYGKLILNEHRLLETQPDHYIFHDHLADENHPLWFHEFAREIEKAGLEYLGDAEFQTMVPSRYEGVADLLSNMGLVRQEQYMDFVSHRSFRRSLLCHTHHRLDRGIDPTKLRGLIVTSTARPGGEVNDDTVRGSQEIEFHTRSDDSMRTDRPMVKATLMELVQHPEGVVFEDLVARARARVGSIDPPDEGEDDEDVVGGNLLNCYVHAVVDFRVRAYDMVSTVSETPRAPEWIKLQAQQEDPVVCSLRHESLVLTRFDQELVQLLDGSRRHSQIIADLIGKVMQGQLTVEQEGVEQTDPAVLFELFREAVPERLQAFAMWGLLSA